MFLLRYLPALQSRVTCFFIFSATLWCNAASAPDIAISGAQIASNAGALCAGDSAEIEIYVNNLGSTTLTLDSLKIAVTINSAFYKTIVWRGPLVLALFPAQAIVLEKIPIPTPVADVVLELLEANGELVPATSFTRTETQIRQGLSGEYALGPNSAQFPDFKSAFDVLKQWGVCGPVTFWVEPGDYYAGTLSVFNGLPGAGAQTPITFAAHALGEARIFGQFSLSNVDGFTLRNLTVQRAISLENCDNFHLDHCNIRVDNGGGISLGKSADGFKMTDCLVQTTGAAINGSVNPGEPTRSGWVIRNCHFESRSGGNTQLQLGNLTDGIVEKNVIKAYVYVDGPSLSFTGNRLIDYSGDQLQNVGASIQSRKAFIANNVFADPGSQLPMFEIWMDSTSDIELYHNTVFREYPTTAVQIKKTGPFPVGTVTAINNNFVNLGTGAALYVDCKTFFSQNNNYYSEPGNPAAVYNNNTYPGATWQNVWKLDTLSLSADPVFFSNSDYLRFANSVLANKGLNLLAEVADDVFGEQRDASPDLGAAESFGAAGDLAVAAIQDGAGNCHGTPAVRVKITNVQSVRPFTYSAQINWSVQGVPQTPYEWTGALAPGDTSDWITIGRHFFDYAGEDLRVSVAHRYDIQNANNALHLPAHRRPMGGAYTIGGVNADFQTLADAATALHRMGMCDTVELQFQSGLHDAVCTLDSIPGNAAERPLLLTSVAGHRDSAVLENIPNFFVLGDLQLLASHVAVRNLSIRLKLLFDNYTMARFDHCRLADMISGISGGDSISIEHCALKPLDFSLYTIQNTQLIFRNNTVENPKNPNNSDPYVHLKFTGFNRAVVEGNTFHFRTGIIPEFGPGSRILNNRFQDMDIASIAGRFAGTAQEPVWIANNFFNNYTNTMATTMLFMEHSQWVRVWHNTFFSGKPPHQAHWSTSAILSDYTTHLSIQNNLFSNQKNAYNFGPDMQAETIDFNRFDNSGLHLPTFGLTIPMNLSTWQDSTGFDLNSAYADPLYQYEVDGTGFDLHLAPVDSLLPRVQNYLWEIPFDLDYAYRDLVAPCAGADEAGGLAPDAFVWPGDANSDKTVNHLDWLYVGLGAGQQLTGPARTDQMTNWAPKLAQNWPVSIAGVNAKHSDTDGNGTITASDTLAILQNFSRMHFFTGIDDRSDVRLVFKNIPPVIKPGEPVTVEVHVEEAGGQPVSLYGLAMTFGFQPALVPPDSLSFTPVAGWFGTPGTDIWASTWVLTHPTTLQAAMTRTTGADATGSGRIGTLRFVPAAGVPADSFQVVVRSDLALSSDGQQVPIGSGTGTFSYTSSLLPLPFFAQPLEISPNPASESIRVTLPQTTDLHLTIFDSSGKVVYQNSGIGGNQTVVSVEHLPVGMYRLILTGSSGIWYGQFVKK